MGGIGLAFVALALFTAIIAFRGTYKNLPPFNKIPNL